MDGQLFYINLGVWLTMLEGKFLFQHWLSIFSLMCMRQIHVSKSEGSGRCLIWAPPCFDQQTRLFSILETCTPFVQSSVGKIYLLLEEVAGMQFLGVWLVSSYNYCSASSKQPCICQLTPYPLPHLSLLWRQVVQGLRACSLCFAKILNQLLAPFPDSTTVSIKHCLN